MPSSVASALSWVPLIAAAALALRILFLLFTRHGPAGLSMPYMNETTYVAASIASGHGFASPFPLAATGPTAMVAPVFPYLVAGIFGLWGTFTTKSLLAIQILNCLFASLTIFPIYALTKRSFGLLTAVMAAWLWVFLPFAWWTPIQDIWDTALTGFLFACVVWVTLAVRERQTSANWAGYGALVGTAALVNPAILSVCPFFFAWLVWEGRRFRYRLRFPAAAIVLCVLVVMPWTIRNHHVLGKWIPLRSNFGLELWLGNNPYDHDVNEFALHPLWNASEAAEFRRVGEITYMSGKKRQALEYMDSHPGATLHSMLNRVWLNWFAVTDRARANRSAWPLYLRALFFANFVMILLSGLAVVLALRKDPLEAMPYLTVLLVFPVPYYLTHTLVRYRFPIEPILTILSIYGALQVWTWCAHQFRSQAVHRLIRARTASLRPAAAGHFNIDSDAPK